MTDQPETRALTPEGRGERGRLWRVELDALPAALVEHALDHLSRWAVPLSPGSLGLPRPDQAGETDLACSLRDLLTYARVGGDSGEGRDLLLSVSILYGSPLGGDTLPEDWTAGEHKGVRGELAEVARAALARVQLADARPVPRLWLAALAGVSVERIDKAARDGEIAAAEPRPARGGRGGSAARDVSAESASAWLRARGVAGL